ncbi:hypothetical protein [Thiomicrorhabdus sediminis]|uniref:Acyl-CoA dehydrogenase C-terminal domain-containing protein n=1 Tax=Thiomicrorhabdus sediminis TaxID=2580412 RepID=A0A4P9K4Z4_9GAMM|nr:hypothetical protein [Thiomicrorhabdus sediminis]QCU89296.1 hypothetical protein FE785_00950 [Thiomicrorhabdus sediminis]
MNNTNDNLLDQVDSLLPLIRQDAHIAAQQGHLTDAVLDGLFDLRLFRLFIARAYNGQGADLPSALRIFEKIASADGATGWLVMIGAGGGLFSGFIEKDAAAQIFTPEKAVIAGSGSPLGSAQTIADQYRVSGRWPYASGAYHATWFTANCQLDKEPDKIISIAVAKEHVTIHDTWSVMGMQATGSHDFSIEPTSIDKSYSFNLFAEPLIDEPIFYCPLLSLAHLTFASVALGIASNALRLFAEFSQQKGTFTQADTKQAYHQAMQSFSQSQQAFYHTADKSWQALVTHRNLDEALVKEVEQVCLDAVHNCLHAIDTLKTHVGMLVVFNDSEFGRAWRDLHVLSQHALLKKTARQ